MFQAIVHQGWKGVAQSCKILLELAKTCCPQVIQMEANVVAVVAKLVQMEAMVVAVVAGMQGEEEQR